MKLASFALVVAGAWSPPAAAAPQFITLERADRQSRLGMQASLQFYPGSGGVYALRTEVYGQLAAQLRGGGVFGGYGHVAIAFPFGDEDELESGVSNVELGGYYLFEVGRGATDLVLHLGISLPTASDDFGSAVTNLLTALERNYDIAEAAVDSTILEPGLTLRTRLGASSFLQADFALDLPIDTPGDSDPIFHANLGIGALTVGGLAILGELATSFSNGDLIGSLAFGLRFPGAAHPHLAYILAFADDDAGLGNGGIEAHILSFGFYVAF